jgi:hypothetical protein
VRVDKQEKKSSGNDFVSVVEQEKKRQENKSEEERCGRNLDSWRVWCPHSIPVRSKDYRWLKVDRATHIARYFKHFKNYFKVLEKSKQNSWDNQY